MPFPASLGSRKSHTHFQVKQIREAGRLGCWIGKALEPQLSPTEQSCMEHPPPGGMCLPSVLQSPCGPSAPEDRQCHCWENLNTGLPVAKLKATLLVGVSCKPILLPSSQHKPCYLRASDAEGKQVSELTGHYIQGRVWERTGLNNNGKTSTFAEAPGTRWAEARDCYMSDITVSDVNENFILNQNSEPEQLDRALAVQS